ncbi:MAG: MBOAT family protein [Gammaproteobacteria bacterium]|nr:MAG: MBOAT family protein [Gammaproteobacteria bacterium]RLA22890.1 MAG: MBOAT family protein [Gammaproteobacteria bacterium]
MLFNSHLFIFLFLPICLIGFFVLGRQRNRELPLFWLVFCSLFFYGWWNPKYAILIIISMLVNYWIGRRISKTEGTKKRKLLLIVGVMLDLSVIAYYKYTTFLVDTINTLSGSDFHLYAIILPLGISFFTFQQIAYLVDAYRDEAHEYNFLHYSLFVTFFPQLIAGPIVHHKEMLPQFIRKGAGQFDFRNISVGLTIFSIGLFKKVVFADGIAEFASPVFLAAENGVELTFLEAWGGALSYTLQLYFDFSGYSDMAIGLARMFGIVLPLNFDSPYKSRNIIEFWRRWHMTLSRFLRDYLYFPLGGNRSGQFRRYRNLLVTMLLGGLWHGAGWTFVFWGFLHGVYLMINHIWHRLLRVAGWTEGNRLTAALALLITFLSVVVAWVFFRAESFSGALVILNGMAGLNGIVVLPEYAETVASLKEWGVPIIADDSAERLLEFTAVRWVVGLLVIAWFFPSTQEIMRDFNPALNYSADKTATSRLVWQPSLKWTILLSLIFVYAVAHLTQVSEFLYFQF